MRVHYTDDDLLPVGLFDESTKMEDPVPFRGWVPSPRQIADWSAVIRAQADRERLDSSRVAAGGVDVPDDAGDGDDDGA